MVGWMEISELGLSSMSAGGRGAARAHFIAVAGDAVVGAARRGGQSAQETRAAPGQAGSGGRWEFGSRGTWTSLVLAPGMEHGRRRLRFRRPETTDSFVSSKTAASRSNLLSFFLGGKKKARAYCAQS